MNLPRDVWDFDITSAGQPLEQSLRAVAGYRDLLLLFTRRDLVAVFKQTLLGPLWIFIQPLVTAVTFAVVFGGIANLPTGDVPHLLFYLCGITFWGLFASTFKATATLFVSNEHIFSKVYFPRWVSILSALLSQFLIFLIQFSVFTVLGLFYFFDVLHDRVNMIALLAPVCILSIVTFAIGLGLLVTSSTVRYRDFRKIVDFGTQLLLYATPVIYPLTQVPDSILRWLRWNPLAAPFETIRAGLLGTEPASLSQLGYAFFASAIMLILGVLAFHRVERNFVDEI